jgi:hypothetical protein
MSGFHKLVCEHLSQQPLTNSHPMSKPIHATIKLCLDWEYITPRPSYYVLSQQE